MLVPVPLPRSIQRWFQDLSDVVRLYGELAEELVRERLDTARMRRADRESAREAVESAEALIPLLNSLKFQEGGIRTTANALLTKPSAKIWQLFQKQIKAGSSELDELSKKIKDSAKLESRFAKEMQLVREIVTQKHGLLTFTFGGQDFDRYAHHGKPLSEEECTALLSTLSEIFDSVNAKISQAVEKLNDFIVTGRGK